MSKLEANFTGSFDNNSQIRSVPQALVLMILNGSNIKLQDLPQFTLSMTQCCSILLTSTVLLVLMVKLLVRHCARLS